MMETDQSAAQPRAIVTPTADLLLAGGGSILVALSVFLIGAIAPDAPWLQTGFSFMPVLLLQLALNMPHFMASYPLLYRRREQVAKHRFVSMYLPFILAVVCIYAVLTPGVGSSGPSLANPFVVDFFAVITTLLLAWHYTGQAWGMVASFAYIAGVRMDKTERLLIRSGLHALLVWHVLWGLRQMLGPLIRDPMTPPMQWVEEIRTVAPSVFTLVEQGYHAWSIVALLTIPVGIVGFVRVYRRTGVSLPLRSIAPWAAIYLWYLLVWTYPGVFLLIQVFHAVQYLAFPLRVEVNEYIERKPDRSNRQVRHTFIYYGILVAAGLAAYGLPQLAHGAGDVSRSLAAIVGGFINLHHYFIDGVIWKIRNPKVQKALFAHLQPTRS